MHPSPALLSPTQALTLDSSGNFNSEREQAVEFQGQATSCALVSLEANFCAARRASSGISCGGTGQLTDALQACAEDGAHVCP